LAWSVHIISQDNDDNKELFVRASEAVRLQGRWLITVSRHLYYRTPKEGIGVEVHRGGQIKSNHSTGTELLCKVREVTGSHKPASGSFH
jgi:hypothetical protein